MPDGPEIIAPNYLAGPRVYENENHTDCKRDC